MKNLAVVVLLLLGQSAWARSPKEMHWSELNQLAGKKVRIVTTEGLAMEGKAVAVDPEAFTVQVKKKGESKVPRASVQTLAVSDPTMYWRLAGVSIGAAAGLVAGAVAVFAKDGPFGGASKGGNAIAVSVAVGVATGGFFLGRMADQRMTPVVILP